MDSDVEASGTYVRFLPDYSIFTCGVRNVSDIQKRQFKTIRTLRHKKCKHTLGVTSHKKRLRTALRAHVLLHGDICVFTEVSTPEDQITFTPTKNILRVHNYLYQNAMYLKKCIYYLFQETDTK